MRLYPHLVATSVRREPPETESNYSCYVSDTGFCHGVNMKSIAFYLAARHEYSKIVTCVLKQDQ